MAIVSRLSRVVGERRLKLKALARATGLAYNTVASLYHDRSHRYDGPVLNALCAYLRVPVGELLEYVPDAATSAGARRRPDRPAGPPVPGCYPPGAAAEGAG